MIPPDEMAAALRNQADGLCCLEAAAELLIGQAWLGRDDFTSRFITTAPRVTDARPMAVVDWPAAIGALDSGQLPCSGGEQRMLRLTASLAEGIPVDLHEALAGIDRVNADLLTAAIRRASGQGR